MAAGFGRVELDGRLEGKEYSEAGEMHTITDKQIAIVMLHRQHPL